MKLFLGIALGLIAATAHSQSIVYDNTTNDLANNFPLMPEWENSTAEAGDEIWLGGTDRQVVQMTLLFFYRGTLPGTFDARLRFRSYDESANGPGSVFYESLTTVQTLPGLHELTFDIPNVVVPDRFVWTIQGFNRQGSHGELGMAYFNPPTVGWSDDFLWQLGGNEWTAYSWGGDPYANFAARLTAVPEPSLMGAMAVGLVWLRRRRARNA